MTTAVIDEGGVYGAILNHAIFFFFFGSALAIFIYYWSKGGLDMDQEPAIQMLQNEEEQR